MGRKDLEPIIAIEKRAFPNPWPRMAFLRCLELNCYCWVFELDAQIIAYAVMAIEQDYAHILNFCVRTKVQRRGLGRRLLVHLLETAQREEARLAFLEVRPSNHAALQLYRSMEFEETGKLSAYYRGSQGQKDALVLVRKLAPLHPI